MNELQEIEARLQERRERKPGRWEEDPMLTDLVQAEADLNRAIAIAKGNDRDCHMYMDQRDQARADVVKSRKVIMRADVDETLAFMADTEHYEVYR